MGPSIINSAHQELAVSEIKPHPSNARRGDLAAISASIKANGFYGSLVVNKRTSHILAGNHRYLAAVDLGFDTVPVTWVDVDAAQELRILAADNRTSELGTFDHDLLDSLKVNEVPATTASVINRGENLFAIGFANGAVKLYNCESGTIICELQAHSRQINGLVCHPTKSVFATCGDDTFLNVWEVSGSKLENLDINLICSSRVTDY